MGILFLIKTKMGFTAEDLQACETFLNENQFLSGKDLPGADDMGVLEGLNANGTIPDFEAYPNVFGWFWTLNALNAPCRALYNVASKADAPKKGGKPEKKEEKPEKKEEKPAPAPVAADDDEDSFDPFADETEEDKAAEEEAEKTRKLAEEKSKKTKKVVIAKSLVTFDVKGYELGQDFEALAKKIKSEITMDGLVWMDKHETKEIAFGMKKLQIVMLIEDEKIATEDVFEVIESWDEEVQSTDIVSFAKA